MATIYARGECWYLNWSQNGRQHRESLGKISERQAEDFRKAKELELSTGKRIFVASALFEDHLERYLTWHRSEYPDSHWRVLQIAEQHLTPFYGVALSQIVSTDIERWKVNRLSSSYKDKPISKETVAKELRTLKAILSKAVEWGELERNPAEFVDAPKSLKSEPIHWYTKAELGKLYKRYHGHVWRIMANTGMRRGEAQQLRWTAVDLKAKHINIISSEAERTKSGRWRQIPLSDSAIAALKALRKKTGKTPFVLPRVTAQSLSRAFQKDLKRLGLGGSLHSLRHSYAAHLVMAGVPLRTLQVLMGHASFVTTERYAHVGKDHLKQQARLINL